MTTMLKKLFITLLLCLLPSLLFANWKMNPYTGKQDYYETGGVAVESDPIVGAVSGIVKANGAGAISAASAGTDYAAALGEDDNYVTDAEKTVIGNTSGANTGDEDLDSIKSLVSNDFHNLGGTDADTTYTFGIADTNKVQINAADVADNDYAKFTATGVEGRSYSEVLSDIGAQGADADLTTWAGITPGANVGTFLATPTSANFASAVTAETGTAGGVVFSNSPTFDDDIQLGVNGADGILKIFSEQGATDYTASIYTNTAMTSNASFYLPVDEPAATSFLNMTTGGVIGFVASSTIPTTSSNLSAFAATTSAQLYGVISDETGSASGTPLAVFNVNPTLTGATMAGNLTLGEGADPATNGIVVDASMSADERYSGVTVPATAGATLAFGDLCYLDVTATEWLLADADAATTSGSVILGICVDASTNGNATSMLLVGTVRSAAFPASIALGAPVYVSTTAGDLTATQPTDTDDVIRVVGHAVTAEPNTIYFNPSPDYITHT